MQDNGFGRDGGRHGAPNGEFKVPNNTATKVK